MGKLRKALVRGSRARFWLYRDDCLVLPHPDGKNFSEVPVSHLADDAMLWEHLARLGGKTWVPYGALEELREIAEGART